MDIGTAKPSKEEIKEIDYHFIDEYNVNEEISLFVFQKKMRKVIDSYISNNIDVIVFDGTLLHIKALLIDYNLKEEERNDKYDNLSLKELQDILREKNLDVFNKVDINNPRGLIRALINTNNGVDSNLKLGKQKLLYPAIFFQIKTSKERLIN